MPKLVVQGIPPYDGEYEVSPTGLTNRDLHTIKQISGVRAGELEEAFEAGDNDLVVAMTVITLRRNGFPNVTADAIWDAEAGQIQLADSEQDKAQEDAGRPLATRTSGGNENAPDGSNSASENSPRSGANGNPAGENSPPTPLLTGDRGSVTSADFAPKTSPV